MRSPVGRRGRDPERLPCPVDRPVRVPRSGLRSRWSPLPLIAGLDAQTSARSSLGILASARGRSPTSSSPCLPGAIVDRVDHRATMIACDTSVARSRSSSRWRRCSPASLSIGVLCVVALVVGSLSVFFTVAYTSYPGRDPPTGGPRRGATSAWRSPNPAARVAGPSIGGALLQFCRWSGRGDPRRCVLPGLGVGDRRLRQAGADRGAGIAPGGLRRIDGASGSGTSSATGILRDLAGFDRDLQLRGAG